MSNDRSPKGEEDPKQGPSGVLYVISAPSGAGKTTLIRMLFEQAEREGSSLAYSVSHTSRAPRSREVDGSSYHFVDEATFESMVERGEFLEWALVHGQYKGTSLAAVAEPVRQGRDIVLDIDVQGAAQVRDRASERGVEVVTIFVLPPSRDVLLERLRGRDEDTPEQVAKRIRNAELEIREASKYDYVIVNDRLGVALEALRAILIARRVRVDHQAPEIAAVLRTFSS